MDYCPVDGRFVEVKVAELYRQCQRNVTPSFGQLLMFGASARSVPVFPLPGCPDQGALVSSGSVPGGLSLVAGAGAGGGSGFA